MNEHNNTNPAEDAALKHLFVTLRDAEAGTAPPSPKEASLALAQSSGWTQFGSLATLPGIAAALTFVAVGAWLLLQPSPAEDPAALYSDIMAGQSIQTDALLNISDSVFPGMHELPGLYDIDFNLNSDLLIN